MPDNAAPLAGIAASSSANDPFIGGGEAAAILRTIDWSKTAMGAVSTWPETLKTSLQLCLSSRHPICVIWGPERIYFYNDAYAPIVGTKHPSALSKSYPTVWPEIWESAVRPILEAVEITGQASWHENLRLVLRRHGYDEECYFSFSFAPIRSGDGSIGGVFTAVTETTAHVITERRLHTLRDLGARAVLATTPDQACRIAIDVLAMNPTDVPFALVYLISGDNRTADRVASTGLANVHVFAPGGIELHENGSGDPWDFRGLLRKGGTLVRSPETNPLQITASSGSDPIEAVMVLPLLRPGETQPSGFAVLGGSPRRAFDDDYRTFFETIGSHLAMAVSNARAYAKEVEQAASAARFEQLMAIMPAGVLACDAQGRITFFNRRATEIWRATPEPMEDYATFAARFRILSRDGSALPAQERQIARALRTGESFERGESLMERPDGSRFVGRYDLQPIRLADGTVDGAIVVFQDVSAERAAELALQQTRERYRAVFEQASVGIFECDLRGQILRTNPALSEIMGFTQEALTTKNWRDLTHPDELASDEALVGQLLRSEVESIRVERRYLHQGGTYGWVDVFATVIRDPAGLPAYGLAVIIDISERKRAEAELRETEDRFRVAADSAPVLIWIADTAKRCTWFNRPWLEFVGRSLEQESGFGWAQNVHPADAERCLAHFSAAFDRREPFSIEYRVRRQDGEYRWLLDNAVPRYQGTEFIGYIGSCIDITERRAAEEAMNASRNAERSRRQEMEVLTQVAPAGIWMAHDAECREITGNAAAYAMLRIPPGQNLSRTDAEPTVAILQNGVPLPVQDLAMRVAARTGQPVTNQELEFRFPDGTSTWAYGSATPLIGEDGKVRGVICVMLDVTQRKLVEAALRASEEQLRIVTDHTSVMFARIDREYRYRFVNRTYSKRHGRPPEDFVGLPVRDVVSPEMYALAKPYLDRALAGEPVQFEVFYPEADRWGHIVYEPERGPDGKIVGLVAVVVDVTDRKAAETEMTRARDQAIAASRAKDDFLAALSHELRTPLSPVLLIASEAATDADLPEHVRADFDLIRKSVELEARLIDDLLDVTRITRNKFTLDLQDVDLATVLRDALATVEDDLRTKRIALTLDLAPLAMVSRGDPVRLQQVFWNVLKNAVKFTADGGRVNVTSAIGPAGTTAIMTVSDTGIGITEEELKRVFHAFSQGDHARGGGSHKFGGLGLGLAISRRVVELHHGEITATSEGRDRGATFTIVLPLAHAAKATNVVRDAALAPKNSSVHAAPQEPGSDLPEPTPKKNRGRILLVEDHSPTRLALEHLLQRRGFDVTSCACAAEARALAKQERFTALVSDVGLPDGSGCELMEEFRHQYAMIGISLTGYGMEDDVARSRVAGFAEHLTKPVRMQALDAALARLLPHVTAE
ncbi:MAG: PAS domain S-box protein [Opitutus sp.]